MNAIFTRRSTRAYLSDAVSEETLMEILQAGNYAPSAMNNQDRQFTVIENKEILSRLNLAVREIVNKETVKRIEDRMDGDFSFFYRAPVLVVVSHTPTPNAAADCACALQNMFLQAQDLGLGSCWINQLNDLCTEPAIREILDGCGVPSEHKVYGCAALGLIAKETPLREKSSKIVFCR